MHYVKKSLLMFICVYCSVGNYLYTKFDNTHTHTLTTADYILVFWGTNQGLKLFFEIKWDCCEMWLVKKLMVT